MTGVVIDVRADTTQADRDLRLLRESVDGIKKSSEATSSQIKNLIGSFVSLGAITAGLNSVMKASADFTELSNKIALVTGRTSDLAKAQDKLINITASTRSSLSSTAMVFNTLGKSLKVSQRDLDSLADVTETIQKAVAVSGASASSAEAALIQLGQGMSAGALRGEELNSVMEQTPRIAQAIADSLKTSLGGLRQAAAEGKITTSVVLQAMQSQAGKIADEFSRIDPTLSQGFTQANVSLNYFLSELDKGLGISDAMGAYLGKNANGLREAAGEIRISAALFMSTLRTVSGGFTQIFKPAFDTIRALWDQFNESHTSVSFVRTLKNDSFEALRQLDDQFNGTFHSIYQYVRFFKQDIFDFDSPVEKAVKNLRRLSPQYWATGGLDSGTLYHFFSVKTLHDYSNALTALAAAVRDNSNSIAVNITDSFRRIRYAFRDLLRYFSLTPDTLLNFKIGDITALSYSFTELGRGITNLQRKIFDFKRIFDDFFGSSGTQSINFLKDLAVALPSKFADAVVSVLNWLKRTVVATKQIYGDMMQSSPWFGDNWFSFSKGDKFRDKIVSVTETVRTSITKLRDSISSGLGDAQGFLQKFNLVDFFSKLSGKSSFELSIEFPDLNRVSRTFRDFVGDVTGQSKLTKALNHIKDFAQDVIAYFRDIWDKVIGHSWWTDTVDGVIEKAASLANRVTGPLDNFARKVKWVFKDLAGADFSISSLKTTKLNSDASAYFEKVKDVLGRIYKPIDDAIKAIRAINYEFYILSSFAAKAAFSVAAFVLGIQALFTGVVGVVGLFTGATKGIAGFTAILQVAFFPLFGIFRILTLFSMAMRTFWAPLIVGVLLYTNVLGSITSSTISTVEKTLHTLQSWGSSVIEVFRNIWDKVIGHSWWTDTMDGVVSKAEDLSARIKEPLARFARTVSAVFKELASGKINIGEVKNAKFTPDIKNKFADLKDGISDTFDKLATKFPETLRTALVGIAGILLAVVLPTSKFKTAIMVAVASSLLAGVALIAEKFASGLVGDSFIKKVGYGLGATAGYFVSSFIKEIPQILNALLGVVSGFVSGFVSQMPILGAVFSKVFDIASVVGLSGPLGLFALFFFGKSTAAFWTNWKVTKDSVEALKTTFSFLQGVVAGTRGGIVMQFLFGTFGATRILSTIALIANSMGVFDSILGNSLILKTIASGGLLWLIIAGKDGIGQMKDLAGKAVAPTFLLIKEIVEKMSGKDGLIFNLIYGKAGSGTARSTMAASAREAFGAIEKIAGSLFESFKKTGSDIFSSALFGGNKEKAMSVIKDAIASAKTSVLNFTTKIGEMAASNNFFKKMWQGEDGTSGLQAKIASIKAKIDAAKDAATTGIAAGAAGAAESELLSGLLTKASEAAAKISASISSVMAAVGTSATAVIDVVNVAISEIAATAETASASFVGDIAKTASSVISASTTVVSAAVAGIDSVLTAVNTGTVEATQNVLKSVTTISEALAGLGASVDAAVNGISAAAAKNINGIALDIVSKIDAVGAAVNGAVSDVTATVAGTVGTVSAAATATAEKAIAAVDGVSAATKAATDGIVANVSAAVGSVNILAREASAKVTVAVEEISTKAATSIDGISVAAKGLSSSIAAGINASLAEVTVATAGVTAEITASLETVTAAGIGAAETLSKAMGSVGTASAASFSETAVKAKAAIASVVAAAQQAAAGVAVAIETSGGGIAGTASVAANEAKAAIASVVAAAATAGETIAATAATTATAVGAAAKAAAGTTTAAAVGAAVAANTAVVTTAGATGLFGKLMFGVVGKTAIVGTVLFILSAFTASFVGESRKAANGGMSAFSEFFDALAAYREQNPFKTWGLAIAPLAIYLAVKFLPLLRIVKFAADAMLSVKALGLYLEGLGQVGKVLAAMPKTLIVTAAVTGLAAAMDASNELMVMIASATAAFSSLFTLMSAGTKTAIVSAFVGMRTALVGLLSMATLGIPIFTAMWEALLGPIGLIAAAIAGVGAILVSVFGNGETFGEKFSDVIHRLAQAFGLLDSSLTSVQDKLEKIANTNLKKINVPGVNTADPITGVKPKEFSAKNIDFTELDPKVKERLFEVAQKRSDLAKKFEQEQIDYGVATAETTKNLVALNKQFQALALRAEGLSQEGFFKEVKDVNKFNQAPRKGTLLQPGDAVSQSFMDAGFALREKVILDQLKKAREEGRNLDVPKYQKSFDDLQKLRTTDYNAKYVAPDLLTKRIQKQTDKFDSSVALTGDTEENILAIKKRAAETLKQFKTVSKEYQIQLQFDKLDPTSNVSSKLAEKRKGLGEEAIIAARAFAELTVKSKKIQEVESQLSAMEGELGKAKVKLDEGFLFAGTEAEFKKLKEDITSLAKTAQEVEWGVSIADKFDKWLNQRDAESKIKLFTQQVFDSATLNLSDQMDKLQTNLKIPNFDFGFTKQLPTAIKLSITGSMQEIERMQLGLKSKRFIINENTPFVERERIAKEFETAVAALETKKKELKERIAAVFKFEGVSGTVAEMNARGLQIPDYIGGHTSDKRIAQYTDLQIRQQQAQARIASRGTTEDQYKTQFPTLDDKGISSKVKEDYRFLYDVQRQLEVVTPRFNTFATAVADLAGVNFDIKFEDIFRIDPGVLSRMQDAGLTVYQISQRIERMSAKELTSKLGQELSKKVYDLKQNGLKAFEALPKSFSEMFSQLSQFGVGSIADYFLIPEDRIKRFKEIAKELKVIDKLLENPYLGIPMPQSGNGSNGSTGDFARADRIDATAIAKQKADLLKEGKRLSETPINITQQFNAVRNAFPDLGIAQDDWNRFSKDLRAEIEALANKANRATADLNELGKGVEVVAPTTSDMLARARSVEERILNSTKSPIKADAMRFANLPVSIDQSAFNAFDNIQKKIIRDLAKDLKKASDNLYLAESDDAAAAAQKIVDKVTKDLTNKINEFSISVEAKRAGEEFAANITNDFTSGVKDYLKGKTSFKDFAHSVLDSITGNIIDTFVNGLSKGLMGSDSELNKLISSFGSSLFATFTGNDKATSDANLTFATAVTEFSLAVAKMTGTSIAGGTGVGGKVSSFASKIASKLGFKTQAEKNVEAGTPALDNTPSPFTIDGTTSSTEGALPGNVFGDPIEQQISILDNGFQTSNDWLKNLESTSSSGFEDTVSSIMKSAEVMRGGFDQLIGFMMTSSLTSNSGGSGLSGIFGSLMNMFGGPTSSIGSLSGIESIAGPDLGSLINMLPAFDVGGAIPGGFGAPIPIMAHGGEVILNPQQQQALIMGGGLGGNNKPTSQVFHLNITGDVSQQTRREINKMIPQIAAGVNTVNYENGTR